MGRKKATFAQIAGLVLELKKLNAPRTRNHASSQIARLVENFGGQPIAEITENDWARYVLREQEKKARRFYDDRKFMRMVLHYALTEGIVQKRIRLPIPDLPSDTGREVTPEEIVALRACASSELRFQIDIAWKMGLRLREMMRLRWDQIDWEKNTIRLSPADTKTRRGREVPIHPDLQKQFCARFELAACQFVFPTPNHTRARETNATAWKRCKRNASVKVRWHDLRHTAASRMLRGGSQPHVVGQVLGMSEKVLSRIYAHADLDDKRAAVAATAPLSAAPKKAG